MKNLKVIFSLIILCFLFYIPTVNATSYQIGIINAGPTVKIRNGAGNYKQLGSIKYGESVQVHSTKETDDGSTICSGGQWSYITYNDLSGYVCSIYITIETPNTEEKPENSDSPDISEEPDDGNEMSKMTEEEFEEYLNSQGFPESYKVKLRELHKKHPTWIFIGVKSKYSWKEAIEVESVSGRSLLNIGTEKKLLGHEGYLSTAPGDYNFATDKFKAYDGIYWFQANEQTIAYYLDPRNYLNETYIFIFENLLYIEETNTVEAINKIFTTSFMRGFSENFRTAAYETKVSALYLAALARQEVGQSNSNIVINGKAGVLADGIDYTGYYNFYNIGASSSSNPKLKSLQSAKAYNWDTPLKAITGGAYLIGKNYINCGQYTRYFQKWNTSPDATKGIWHQYATDILWPVGPSATTSSSYNSMGIIDSEFTFTIPIYSGIDEISTSLPSLGNPNNWLSDLKVNDISVSNFSGDKTEYHVIVPYTNEVNIKTTTVNSNSTTNNLEKYTFTEDIINIEIIVTAQNKSQKTYKLTIERLPDETTTDETITIEEVLNKTELKYNETHLWNISLGTSVTTLTETISNIDNLVSINIKSKDDTIKTESTINTGDKITISNSEYSNTYEIVIYGDVNEDGEINVKDLLAVQKHIIKDSLLKNAALEAADINRDGIISTKDLLLIQKSILNIYNISQS